MKAIASIVSENFPVLYFQQGSFTICAWAVLHCSCGVWQSGLGHSAWKLLVKRVLNAQLGQTLHQFCSLLKNLYAPYDKEHGLLKK